MAIVIKLSCGIWIFLGESCIKFPALGGIHDGFERSRIARHSFFWSRISCSGYFGTNPSLGGLGHALEVILVKQPYQYAGSSSIVASCNSQVEMGGNAFSNQSRTIKNPEASPIARTISASEENGRWSSKNIGTIIK